MKRKSNPIEKWTISDDKYRYSLQHITPCIYNFGHSVLDIDNDSLSSDIDDRCESDISGTAHDDDLSSVMYNVDLGPGWLSVGNVMRSYRHNPNANLNHTLTIIAMLALFTVVGVGIGHYLGLH